jgi:GMP synthase-like glutamine amidotransferase
VLGICFGAQQLATVLGGEVTRASVAEIGWLGIRAVSESSGDVPACMVDGPWMQWHYDRFSVPAGATALAESAAGPQAIRAGRCLGVQFHPEATETIVAQWSTGSGADELAGVGVSREDLLADTRIHVIDSEARCRALVDWFLAEMAQPHMQSGRAQPPSPG